MAANSIRSSLFLSLLGSFSADFAENIGEAEKVGKVTDSSPKLSVRRETSAVEIKDSCLYISLHAIENRTETRFELEMM